VVGRDNNAKDRRARLRSLIPFQPVMSGSPSNGNTIRWARVSCQLSVSELKPSPAPLELHRELTQWQRDILCLSETCPVCHLDRRCFDGWGSLNPLFMRLCVIDAFSASVNSILGSPISTLTGWVYRQSSLMSAVETIGDILHSLGGCWRLCPIDQRHREYEH